MTNQFEHKLLQLPLVKKVIFYLKKFRLPWLNGFTFYDLIQLYVIGLTGGALSNRSRAIAFSFFMSLFPFALFIFNLIPFIPIQGFQADFMQFVSATVPPNTFSAIQDILDDILNHSNSGLLSSGFLLSIFLMSNGVNAIFGGFQNSKLVDVKRTYFKKYFIAIGISLLLSLLLLVTIAAIVIFEVWIQQSMIHRVLSDKIPLIQMGRFAFVALMILMIVSILLKYGISQRRSRALISIGAVFTTILIVLNSYLFGIWVIHFSKYNELYGSIGTLLIVMFYIWLNCLLLLLGFELDASIYKLKEDSNKIN
jgi:membrane protein